MLTTDRIKLLKELRYGGPLRRGFQGTGLDLSMWAAYPGVTRGKQLY